MKKHKSEATAELAKWAQVPALRAVAALEPQELSQETRRAAQELLLEGQSANTRASYAAALRYWVAWFAARYGGRIALPVHPATVIQFIVDHAQRKPEGRDQVDLVHDLPPAIDALLVAAGYKGKPGALALTTLAHRVSVLSKLHQDRKLPNPCADAEVKELLKSTRSAYALRNQVPEKKSALTRDLLQRVLDGCDDSLAGKRDRALLLFAWASGGRRRSEVAAADMKFLRRTAEGYSYRLVFSKTNRTGQDLPTDRKPILDSAAGALEDWLAAAGITEGRIFRRVGKGGRLGESLTPKAVWQIVTRRCKAAAVEGTFSAHSLRSGFITEAARAGVPLNETMAMSGHASVQTVLGYMRTEEMSKSRAARLFDASGKQEAE